MDDVVDMEKKRLSFENHIRTVQIHGRPLLESEAMLRRNGPFYYNEVINVMWGCCKLGMGIQQKG